jgi:hypothetical protein
MAVRIWTGTDASAPARPEDFKVSWAGLVVATGEHNHYDDSDFYAVVWDNGQPREVEYATTRGWTYRNSAAVDADPATVAAYEGWLAADREARAADRAAAEAARIAKGTTVEVVRGRTVPAGTTGTVIWAGTRYGRDRIGVKDAAGTVHWTDARNAEVVTA